MGNDYLNNEETPEYIICAAIWIKDGKQYVHQPKNIESGLVICGRRHHNCFTVLSELKPDWKDNTPDIEQGFMTSKDRYLDRKESALIALERTQTKTLCSPLFSEDLY